jgi:hypothetical protein
MKIRRSSETIAPPVLIAARAHEATVLLPKKPRGKASH